MAGLKSQFSKDETEADVIAASLRLMVASSKTPEVANDIAVISNTGRPGYVQKLTASLQGGSVSPLATTIKASGKI